MKRFMVLAVGLAFLCSTVAFAADKAPKGEKKDKAAVTEAAPAAAPAMGKEAPAAPEKPAMEGKAEKKAEKKSSKKASKKAEKKTEEAPAAK